MKKSSRISHESIFIFFSLIILTGLLIYLILFTPISYDDRWKEVMIPEGSTYSEGIGILKKQGAIKHEYVFLMIGRVTGLDRKLRAGYYNLSTSMSAWDVFNRLRKGMIVEYDITIPEGSTLNDIISKLKAYDLIDETNQQLVSDSELLDFLNIESPSLEGYLFPDTYSFAKGVDPRDIFRIMVNRLRENYDETMHKRARELNMTEREVLTLASIIEHEALLDRERPVISAVYHNRLNKKMRLQADPTVVYGIKRMQEGITRSDLRRKTPYNTYVIKGLPPGPIASPGIKSIKAALYPADADYLYFVSKNNGEHHFSKTGEEHLRAVMLYQRGGSAPRVPLDQPSETFSNKLETNRVTLYPENTETNEEEETDKTDKNRAP
jgi:UPF0755 protein